MSSIITPQVLAVGSCKRATYNISSDYATLFLGVGSGGASGLSAGVDIIVRRLVDNMSFPSDDLFFEQHIPASASVCNIDQSGGVSSGVTSFGIGGSVSKDDKVCLWGTTAIPNTLSGGTLLSKAEFARVSKKSGSTLTLDSPLKNSHYDDEFVIDSATVYTLTIEGSCSIEVIFDYGEETTGANVLIACWVDEI